MARIGVEELRQLMDEGRDLILSSMDGTKMYVLSKGLFLVSTRPEETREWRMRNEIVQREAGVVRSWHRRDIDDPSNRKKAAQLSSAT